MTKALLTPWGSRLLSAGLLAFGVAVALAACGSSSSNSRTSSPASSSGDSLTTAPTSSASAPTANVKTGVSYTGGQPGRANPSASPITIGWVNSQGGGPFVFPEATVAAEIATKFVNEQLGGIGGHPLRLVTCKVAGQEADGQVCGQQMANDAAISAVALGNLFIGNGPLYTALAGKKPVIGTVSTSPDDLTAHDAYFLMGSQSTLFGGLATYVKEGLKAKSAAVIYEAAPGADTAGFAVRDALKALGVAVKAVGYPPSATDLSAALTAAGAQTADVVVPMVAAPGCIASYKGLQELGLQSKPVATSALCTDPAVVGATGDLPRWSYQFTANPSNPAGNPQVALYDAVMQQYGGKHVNYLGGSAVSSFGEIMTIAKLLNHIGATKVSAATIRSQVKAFRGPVFLGPPSVECGKTSATPSICADQSTAQTYLGGNKWNTNGNVWYTPPAGEGA
jgi:branched-chain amino acid transport system substrate-binding protein